MPLSASWACGSCSTMGWASASAGSRPSGKRKTGSSACTRPVHWPVSPARPGTVHTAAPGLGRTPRSDTLPVMDIEGDAAEVGHEAKIGRISDEAIFYLTSRGIDEDEARALIVRGFVEPIAKELPLEYAVEMNNLVNIELEGTMG